MQEEGKFPKNVSKKTWESWGLEKEILTGESDTSTIRDSQLRPLWQGPRSVVGQPEFIILIISISHFSHSSHYSERSPGIGFLPRVSNHVKRVPTHNSLGYKDDTLLIHQAQIHKCFKYSKIKSTQKDSIPPANISASLHKHIWMPT